MWSVCSPIHCKPVLGSHGHLWLVEAGQTSEETSLTAVTVHLYEYVEKKCMYYYFAVLSKRLNDSATKNKNVLAWLSIFY